MIRSVRIARYRGIRELAVDGFGRINIVIGKNDSGKTALMEAVQLAEDPELGAYQLLRVQKVRHPHVKAHDLDRFWRSSFHDLDAKAGLSISATQDDGVSVFSLRQVFVGGGHILVDGDSRDSHGEEPLRRLTWALEQEVTLPGVTPVRHVVQGTSSGIKLPAAPDMNGERSFWISSAPRISEIEVGAVSTLKQRGEDGLLVELLRQVNDRLAAIELLAPGGDVAELFVRLDNGTPMLPVALMGQGFQHCLEIGAIAAAHDWPNLFIDEIENGLHHSVLKPLWRWIAMISRQRNLQVFATTHSEECVYAARQAFQELDDDGLRVIRLDRRERETRAVVYDRASLETAERTEVEIRG